MHARCLPLVAMVLVAPMSFAGQPLLTNRVVCAIEAPICARANVQTNETVVSRSDPRTRTQEKLWSFPAWLRITRITESGDVLLAEVEPFNQLPADPTPDLVVLRRYVRGALGKEFRIGEFAQSEQELQSLLRAPAWSMALGSENCDVAKYLLASGRRVAVRLSTGEVIFE